MGVDLLIYSVCHLLLFGFSFDVVFVLVIVTFILCHFVFAFFFALSLPTLTLSVSPSLSSYMCTSMRVYEPNPICVFCFYQRFMVHIYIRTLFMCTLYWLNAFPDSLILDHFMCSIFSSVNKKVSFWKVFVLIDLVFCGIFRLFFCFPWKSTFLFIVTTSLLYFLYIVMLSNLLENLYHQSTILK